MPRALEESRSAYNVDQLSKEVGPPHTPAKSGSNICTWDVPVMIVKLDSGEFFRDGRGCGKPNPPPTSGLLVDHSVIAFLVCPLLCRKTGTVVRIPALLKGACYRLCPRCL